MYCRATVYCWDVSSRLAGSDNTTVLENQATVQLFLFAVKLYKRFQEKT